MKALVPCLLLLAAPVLADAPPRPHAEVDKEITHLQKDCDQRRPGACAKIVHDEYELDAKSPAAQALLEKSCTGGDQAMCADLGAVLVRGNHGAKDPTRGRKLVEDACKAGNGHGCSLYGALLQAGLAGEPDNNKAVTLYTKACDAGDGEGCGALGEIFRRGVPSVRRDYVRARAAFERGCNLQQPGACAELAMMLTYGDGGPADAKRGKSLLKKACAAHIDAACAVLSDPSMKK